MALYPFTKIMDGADVTGVVFDRPIPWPAFDGPGARTADLIAGALPGETHPLAVAEEKRDQALNALGDLADEVTEECEGNLDAVKEAITEARQHFALINDRLSAAQPLLRSADAARFRDDVQAQVGALRDAAKHALHEDVFAALDELRSCLRVAESRLHDAVIDLTKQAKEAREAARG
jgi:hypothetical protein